MNFYEKIFFGLSGRLKLIVSKLQCTAKCRHKTEFLSLPPFLCPRLKEALCKMFMSFIYYRNIKCLGRAQLPNSLFFS